MTSTAAPRARWLASIGAAQYDPEIAAALGGRYAAVHRVVRQAFRRTPSAPGRRPPAREVDLLVGEVFTPVGGIVVSALADPVRYPPERQRGLAARVLARVVLAQA